MILSPSNIGVSINPIAMIASMKSFTMDSFKRKYCAKRISVWEQHIDAPIPERKKKNNEEQQHPYLF